MALLTPAGSRPTDTSCTGIALRAVQRDTDAFPSPQHPPGHHNHLGLKMWKHRAQYHLCGWCLSHYLTGHSSFLCQISIENITQKTTITEQCPAVSGAYWLGLSAGLIWVLISLDKSKISHFYTKQTKITFINYKNNSEIRKKYVGDLTASF